jgi:hypothetical protein
MKRAHTSLLSKRPRRSSGPIETSICPTAMPVWTFVRIESGKCAMRSRRRSASTLRAQPELTMLSRPWRQALEPDVAGGRALHFRRSRAVQLDQVECEGDRGGRAAARRGQPVSPEGNGLVACSTSSASRTDSSAGPRGATARRMAGSLASIRRGSAINLAATGDCAVVANRQAQATLALIAVSDIIVGYTIQGSMSGSTHYAPTNAPRYGYLRVCF